MAVIWTCGGGKKSHHLFLFIPSSPNETYILCCRLAAWNCGLLRFSSSAYEPGGEQCAHAFYGPRGASLLSLLPHLKRREFVLLHSCITCHLVCCLRACCRRNNVTPSCRCVDWCVFSSMLLRLPYSFSHFPPPQSGRYESRGWGIIPSLHKNGPADPYVRHKLPQEVANEVSHIKVRIGNRWLNTDECKQLCAVPFLYPVSTLWLCSSLWPDLVSVVSTAI